MSSPSNSLGSVPEENKYSAPDEHAAAGAASGRGNTHSLPDDPTGELSKSPTLTMDPNLGLRFKSMHRSNPLVSHGDSADEDSNEEMVNQQAESPATVGSNHPLSSLGLGDGQGAQPAFVAYALPDPEKSVSQKAGHPSTAPPRALTFTEEETMLVPSMAGRPSNDSPPRRMTFTEDEFEEGMLKPTVSPPLSLARRRSTSYSSAVAEAEAAVHSEDLFAKDPETTLIPMLRGRKFSLA